METTTDNGKTVAIISYITLIGWIIALVMNNGNKTALGSFHIRQSLGIGLVSAVEGEMKPVPVLGAQFQEWFKGI